MFFIRHMCGLCLKLSILFLPWQPVASPSWILLNAETSKWLRMLKQSCLIHGYAKRMQACASVYQALQSRACICWQSSPLPSPPPSQSQSQSPSKSQSQSPSLIAPISNYAVRIAQHELGRAHAEHIAAARQGEQEWRATCETWRMMRSKQLN